MFANFIGVPRLGHQLAQAAHDLVALVVGQIVVIELAETGVDLHQLVDQGAAGDLRRVRRQYQLDGKLRHRVLQLFVAELFVFETAEQLRQRFRIAGGFAVGRNAVVLLGDVGQVEELAEGARHRQQLVVGQVLQGGEQLLAMRFVAGA